MRCIVLAVLAFALSAGIAVTSRPILLIPDRVFDGTGPRPHPGGKVLVERNKIVAAGADVTAPPGPRRSHCRAPR